MLVCGADSAADQGQQRRCKWVATGLLAVLLLAPLHAVASTGSAITIPPAGFTPGGWQFVCDNTWVEGCGYRPVTLTINSSTARPADTTIQIEFRGHTLWNSEGVVVCVNTELELPAGNKSVSKLISVPEQTPWQSFSVDVSIDGQLSKALSLGNTGMIGASGNQNAGNEPTWLLIGANQDTSALGEGIALVAGPNYNRYSSTANTVGAHNFLDRLATQLPGGWINYTGVDLLMIPLGDLLSLPKVNPPALEAIRDWTASGGNLIVTGVGEDWSRLREIDQFLKLPEPEDKKSKLPAPWKEPEESEFREAVTLKSNTALNQTAITVDPNGVTTTAEKTTTKDPEKIHFVWREASLGMVVAMASDKPLPGDPVNWAWLLNTVTRPRWNWIARHGASMVDENPGFWDFLIPDVGLAPVTAYRVLITLFVVAIGPVNYWFLRRNRRIHYLLLTVPLSALLISALLFAYALASDGLGVRLRTRSYTHIDQHTSRAECLSRISYYAGLAPSSGLRFPQDMAVFPMEHSPRVTYYDSPPQRQFIWDEDQHLARGWLGSRTPTQFICVRPVKTEHRLAISDSANAETPPTVKNQLGAPIRHLLLRDVHEQLYYGGATDDGAEVKLVNIPAEKATLVGAMPELTAMLNDLSKNQPKLPMDNQPASPNGMFGFRGRRYWYGGSGTGYQVADTSSRMEDSILRIQRDYLLRDMLPAKSYVAIVESDPHLVVGLPNLQEEASFHIIEGEW